MQTSNDKKDAYIIQHCSSEDDLLAELNRQTNLKMLNPGMIAGHYQGKFLELVSRMINPDLILEIGTFTGYSAICLARGLNQNGMLHTIEINDEITSFALDFIRRSGLEEMITMHTGDAIEIIPSLAGPFDLVFIDGDKSQYNKYFHLAFPKVKKGGFILADNVLWGGKVYDQKYINDEDTKHIRDFNKMISEDSRLEQLLLPIRDGLMIIRKK
jgi:caffeoyl-CoA O-methyltransferase